MSAQNLINLINKILDPIKNAIPARDYQYLKTRMLEIGGLKVSIN